MWYLVIPFIIIATLYVYHYREVESGNEGIPMLNDALKKIDESTGWQLTPVPHQETTTPLQPTSSRKPTTTIRTSAEEPAQKIRTSQSQSIVVGKDEREVSENQKSSFKPSPNFSVSRSEKAAEVKPAEETPPPQQEIPPASSVENVPPRVDEGQSHSNRSTYIFAERIPFDQTAPAPIPKEVISKSRTKSKSRSKKTRSKGRKSSLQYKTKSGEADGPVQEDGKVEKKSKRKPKKTTEGQDQNVSQVEGQTPKVYEADGPVKVDEKVKFGSRKSSKRKSKRKSTEGKIRNQEPKVAQTDDQAPNVYEADGPVRQADEKVKSGSKRKSKRKPKRKTDEGKVDSQEPKAGQSDGYPLNEAGGPIQQVGEKVKSGSKKNSKRKSTRKPTEGKAKGDKTTDGLEVSQQRSKQRKSKRKKSKHEKAGKSISRSKGKVKSDKKKKRKEGKANAG